MNLYEIPQQLTEIMDIDDDELRKNELVKLELKAQNTFIGLINFIKSKESDFEQIDTEIKRLQEIKRTRQNKVDGLKLYIKSFMESNGIRKQDFPTFSLTVQRNPPSVEIVDDSLIPEKYKHTETIIKINKTEIKNDIISGIEVAGADLITNKTSLRIK